MAPERGTEDPSAEIDPAFEAELHADGVTFDGEDATLLRTIDETGSLNAATDRLGRSYSRTHERIDALEAAFGPLVEPERGGSGGGGTELTARTRTLLARFERLRTEFSGVTAVEETVYEGVVVDRDGEIATVQTAAGELGAITPPETEAVQVTIRADTVTLHSQAEAPTSAGTSARNQFAGTVETVDERESVVSVGVDIGAEQPLTALVTQGSAAELGLTAGASVVASFKTTATRATPRQQPEA
ncbi:TOBE domain-containing protein [Halobacteriaceae archaeon SHR40]|uniref:molybdenum-dependent transcriptional regulator n=1 Tax=Halovenus amylolytica TaxID=2500550 RepID=UPI000FE3548C